MATRIQLRRDTKSNWDVNNPILASGEIGIELGTNPPRFKIGDGVSNWSALSYANSDATSDDLLDIIYNGTTYQKVSQIEFKGDIIKVTGTANNLEVSIKDSTEIGYGFLDTTTPPQDESWVTAIIKPNSEILIPASNQGDKYLALYVPIFLEPLISKMLVNNTDKEFTIKDSIVHEQYYKVLIANDKIDTTSTTRLRLEFGLPASSQGLTIDDGVTDSAGVSKINIKGANITGLPNTGSLGTGEIDLKCGPSVHMAPPNQQFGLSLVDEVIVEPPLSVFDDPDSTNDTAVRLEIEHGYFELSKPPGYYACLTEDEEVIGRLKSGETGIKQGVIWFDDVIAESGTQFLQIDKTYKSIGIQDYTGDDPNVTGGVPFLIISRIAMKGNAVNDGYVEVFLRKTDKGTPTQDGSYLLDSNGNPIGTRKQYKSGDRLGYLECMAIYNAKELVEFEVVIEHDFVDDGVLVEDRTEGLSCIVVQALSKDYKTGDALQQFEIDTMQNVEFSSHYNGEDIFNIAWALSYDKALVDIAPGSGETSVDGLHLYNSTNVKVGISNNALTIKDNGSDVAYYNIGNIFSAEKTLMLRNKDIDVSVTLQDKDQAFRIYMAKWLGNPDAFTKKIITGINNDAPLLETNWELDGNIFISEDVLSGEHTQTGVLTVPSDANNFAVILVPVTSQQPSNLILKGFKVDVSEPFTGYVLKAPELIGEKHLQFSDEHKKIAADNAGHAEFRYTIDDTPSTGMPMPIGTVKSGNANITLDRTVNQVSGSDDHKYEGAIKFNSNGKAKIKTQLYVWSDKAHSVVATTKFWFSKVSSDGNTFTKIPLSELEVGVRGQTKAINVMPEFIIDVVSGDRIALFALSDQADGAYIKAVSGDPKPMVNIDIEFDEITEDEQDLIDKLSLLDQEIVITQEAQDAGWYIELDYDPSTQKPSLSPKQRNP